MPGCQPGVFQRLVTVVGAAPGWKPGIIRKPYIILRLELLLLLLDISLNT
jgi:hypothetical protein